MRYRNAVTRFVMVLILLIVTLCVSVLPGAAKNDKFGEGCSPAFWKNLKKSGDAWAVPYAPDYSFESAFGVDTPNTGDLQLLDALKAGGGVEAALWRHATAALLNAASPDVGYLYHLPQTVISEVQRAYNTGKLEEVKDQFKAANKAVCPLK
jgi:hypothetical protein